MKVYLPILSSVCLLFGAGCASTQTVSAQSAVPVTVVLPQAGPMDQLLAPISLYPDALVAILLPAATASSDVVLAARFLNSGNSPDQIDDQPWDDSVKSLAHYPDVVKWMDENLAWTQQLGAAYLDQPQEVMAAIQRNRQRARANGILVDTPQQQVVIEDGYIRIIPAQADVIYVPRYDPEIVYVERPVYYESDPWLTFGIGFGVGSWLAYDCDWHSRMIWVDRNRSRWREHHDWRHSDYHQRPGYASRPPGWQQWHPTPGRPRPYPRFVDNDHWRNQPRPLPIVGAPHYDQHRNDGHTSVDKPRPGNPDRPDRRHNDRPPSPATNPIVNSTQPTVSNPLEQRQREHGRPGTDQVNRPRRNGPSDPSHANIQSPQPVVRSERTPVPAVSTPPQSSPVAASPVVTVPRVERSRPVVPNPTQRRINPNPGERTSEVRQAVPRPVTPAVGQQPAVVQQPRPRPMPSVAAPMAQPVQQPAVARVPQATRQPEMRMPPPVAPRVERSAAPPPQASQSVARATPAPQASPQASQSRGQGQVSRADRADRKDQN